MKETPNDYSRCLGNHCCYKLKEACKRWITTKELTQKTTPTSIIDFTPTKEKGGNWNCEFKLSKR